MPGLCQPCKTYLWHLYFKITSAGFSAPEVRLPCRASELRQNTCVQAGRHRRKVALLWQCTNDAFASSQNTLLWCRFRTTDTSTIPRIASNARFNAIALRLLGWHLRQYTLSANHMLRFKLACNIQHTQRKRSRRQDCPLCYITNESFR